MRAQFAKSRRDPIALPNKHVDHDHIVTLPEIYLDAWRPLSPDRVMEFIDPGKLRYLCFGPQSHSSSFNRVQSPNLALTGHDSEVLSHVDIKDLLPQNSTDFCDVKIKTCSIHGHRDFTARE